MQLACGTEPSRRSIRRTTDMTLAQHSHLIEVDEGERSLTIYRVRDGERELYTSVKLPASTCDIGRRAISSFCRTLGENILFDSPAARRLLSL